MEIDLNYTNVFPETLDICYQEEFSEGSELSLQYENSIIHGTVIFDVCKFLSLLSWDSRIDDSNIPLMYQNMKGARVWRNVSLAPFFNLNIGKVNADIRTTKILDSKIDTPMPVEKAYISKDCIDYLDVTIDAIINNTTLNELTTFARTILYDTVRDETVFLSKDSSKPINDMNNNILPVDKYHSGETSFSEEPIYGAFPNQYKNVLTYKDKSGEVNKDINNLNTDKFIEVKNNNDLYIYNINFGKVIHLNDTDKAESMFIEKDVYGTQLDYKDWNITTDPKLMNIAKEFISVDYVTYSITYNGYINIIPSSGRNTDTDDAIPVEKTTSSGTLINEMLRISMAPIDGYIYINPTSFNLAIQELNTTSEFISLGKETYDEWYTDKPIQFNTIDNELYINSGLIIDISYNKNVMVNEFISFGALIVDMYYFTGNSLERIIKDTKDQHFNSSPIFLSDKFKENNTKDMVIDEQIILFKDTGNLYNINIYNFADKLIKDYKDLGGDTSVFTYRVGKDMDMYLPFIEINHKNEKDLNIYPLIVPSARYIEDLFYSDMIGISIGNLDLGYIETYSIYRNQVYVNYLDAMIDKNFTTSTKGNDGVLIDDYNKSISDISIEVFYSDTNKAIDSIVNEVRKQNIGVSLGTGNKDTSDLYIDSELDVGKKDTNIDGVDKSLYLSPMETYIFPDTSDHFLDKKEIASDGAIGAMQYYNFFSLIPSSVQVQTEREFVSKRSNMAALTRAVFLGSPVLDVAKNAILVRVDSINNSINIGDLPTSLSAIIVDVNYNSGSVAIDNIVRTVGIIDSTISIDSFTNSINVLDKSISGEISKDLNYSSTDIFISDIIKEGYIDKVLVSAKPISELFLYSDMISFNTELLLKVYNQQIPSVKFIDVDDIEKLAVSMFKKDNDLNLENVFILDKSRLDTMIPMFDKLRANKELRDIIIGTGTWVYDPTMMAPLDFTAGGVDELLLPQTDFNYSAFKEDLLDPVTFQPIAPVQKIDDKTFIAKRPVTHPLPELNNIGLEYADVDVNLLRFLIDKFYTMWQANIFTYGGYDMRDALVDMLENISAYISINVPDSLIPGAERIVRLMRWYGEAAIVKNAQYKIHIEYDPLKSDLYKGSCNIPSIMQNIFVDNTKFTLTNQDVGIDAYIEFSIANPVSTTISFAAYLTSGILDVYINNIKVDSILASTQLISYDLDKSPDGGDNKVKLYFQNVNNNGIINIANVVVNEYVYSDMITEYEPCVGTGNKVLDELVKRVALYADLYSNNANYMQDTINGNLAITDLVDQLQTYFSLHHDQKIKGKRLIMKR